jgi:predicted TIM-barrel fold metal-dependent hydrolase
MMELEGGGWPSRRGLARMIFGGVFERHPGLRLVMAEQAGDWWDFIGREMDSSWKGHWPQLKAQVPKPPSQYLTEHVYIGASFTAPFEARAAAEGGYETNMMWGRDYPHIEGTFQNLEPDQENMTHLSLRHGFAGLPADKVQLMVGGNLLRVFGIDEAPLADLARRIGAPTLDDLSQAIDEVPALGGTLAFRTIGAWG